MSWSRRAIILALIAIPLFFPWMTSNSYYLHGLLCRIVIFTLLAVSLDLIVGYLGDIAVGHAGLFAVGAYTVAILTASPIGGGGENPAMLYFPQFNFVVAMALGVGLSAFVGLILAFPSLRLTGQYLAVTTLAYGYIIHTLLIESEKLTNGSQGIHLKTLNFMGVEFQGGQFWWIVYPSAVAVFFMVRNLCKSYWGRALEAIRESSVAAEGCGVDRTKFKVGTFVFSAAIAGFAGGLFTRLDNYIGTETFAPDLSFFMILALIFGGVRSLLGCLIGTASFFILPDMFGFLRDYRLSAFGVLLLVTLYFMPNGIVGVLDRVRKKLFGDRDHHDELAKLDAMASKVSLESFFEPKKCEGEVALQMRGLEMAFGGVKAVSGLDLTVKANSIHGVIGPNGSGKSTLVNLISGVYVPQSGDIELFGKRINKLKPFKRSSAGIARTYQNLQLFSEMTCLENVLVGMHHAFKSSVFGALFGSFQLRRRETEMRVRALVLLKFMGLGDCASKKARELAYGQARRLEIARALASQPGLILLDEPAAGFSASEIQDLAMVLRKIRSLSVTIVLIEHRMDLLMSLCDEVTVLNFGKKIAGGAVGAIQSDPSVIEAYLGRRTQRFRAV